MQPLLASRFGSTLAIAVTLSAFALPPGTLHASDDYEFAVALLKVQKERPAFQAEDLVERLVQRLKRSTNETVRWEGRLIEALLLRTQAARASADKRTELLGQAEAVCNEFLQKNARHARRPECLEQVSEIRVEFVRALLSGEDDGSPKRLDARKRAVAMVEGMLPERKAAADAAWTELERISLPEDPMAEYPPSLLRRLGAAIEKAVVADQGWLTTWLLLIEACPPGERRGKEIGALTALCQKRIDHERLMDCDLACALYQYLKGRAFAFLPDEPKATEAWQEALKLLPETVMEEAVASTVYSLQTAVLHDYVKMKEKGAAEDPTRYEEIVRVVRVIVRSARYPEIIKLPAGKQLIIDFSLALARQPESGAKDLAEAFRYLREVAADGPPWSNNAALAMARMLTEAGPRKQPKLGAAEWYETARGCLMQGQCAFRDAQEKETDGDAEGADADRQEAFRHFEHALQFYRRAIAAARDTEQTDLLTRLNIEPNAWFESGICYQRMDGLVEACVAYNALIQTFGPEGRRRWLPAKLDTKTRGQVEAIFAALDKAGDKGSGGLLQRAAHNRSVAARRMNPRDRTRAGADDALAAYERGRLLMEEGKRLEEQASAQLRDGRRADATKNWTEALARYRDAIAAFDAEEATSPSRELALYHAGYARLLAQSVLVERLARLDVMKPDEVEAQARELAEAGLQAFREYETHTSLTHQPSPDVEERRAKLAATIRQVRTHLLYNAGRLEECVSAADECLKAEKVGPKDAPRDAALGAVLFARYRALARLAGTHPPPACDPYLEQAEATVKQLTAHEQYRRYALSDLAARYHKASADATAKGAAAAAVLKYDRQTAGYLWASLQAQPEGEREMDDYYRVLGALNKVADWSRLVDVAQEMLKRFDAEKKGVRIAGADWPTILRKMHGIILYPDLRKREACLRDHTLLVDHLYEDERNAGRAETGRPEEDRFPVDLDKARLQLQTIRANYPDCATFDPKQGRNGRSWLQVVEEEIEYRKRILTARDALANAAIQASEAAEATRPEQAVKYRDIAREQLELLLEHWGNVPDVKLKIAQLSVANKDYKSALQTLLEVKRGEENNPGSPLYISTSVRIARVYRLMGDARSASEYPHFMLAVGGPWQKYFPDIHEFLDWCYANGAPRPKEVESRFDGELNYGMQSADEVEFEESVAPAYRKGAPEDLPPSVKWRYEFLKRKIEQAKELAELDRFIQSRRDQAGDDEVALESAKARHELLVKLGEDKTRLWALHKEIDHAIVALGSVVRMRQERAALLTERDELTRSIAEMEKQLKELPEVDTSADAGP